MKRLLHFFGFIIISLVGMACEPNNACESNSNGWRAENYLCGDFTCASYTIWPENYWPSTFTVIYKQGENVVLECADIDSLFKSATKSGKNASECISSGGIYKELFKCNTCVDALTAYEAWGLWERINNFNAGEYSTEDLKFNLTTGEMVIVYSYDVSGCFVLDDSPCYTSYSLYEERYRDPMYEFYSPIALYNYAKNEATTFKVLENETK